jgi:hypothetical protein
MKLQVTVTLLDQASEINSIELEFDGSDITSNAQFADVLIALAQQIRNDVKLLVPQKKEPHLRLIKGE